MDAHGYLSQIRRLDDAINRKNEQHARLKESAMRITPMYSDRAGVCGSGASDRLGEIAADLVELSKQIDELTDRFVDLKKDAIAMMRQLPEREKRVLYLYYIRYRNLTEISWRMGVHRCTICRIRKKALKTLDMQHAHVL